MIENEIALIRSYLLSLQDQICSTLELEEPTVRFMEDAWERPEGGGGRSRVLSAGEVFEQAGVNFSMYSGLICLHQLLPSVQNSLIGNLRPWECHW